jgi:hypothetical protein
VREELHKLCWEGKGECCNRGRAAEPQQPALCRPPRPLSVFAFPQANFYERGHAARLLAAGCALPRPMLVERAGDGQLTIVMDKLTGRSGSMGEKQMKSLLKWLAT